MPCQVALIILAAIMVTAGARAETTNLNDLLGGLESGEAEMAPQPAPEPAGVEPATTQQGDFRVGRRKVEKAVALVVAMLVDGKGRVVDRVPIGTAWAFEPTKLATNAHVVKGLVDIQEAVRKKGGDAIGFVAPNLGNGAATKILGAKIHPRYDDMSPDLGGRVPAAPTYDLGILEVEEPMPATVTLADEAVLHQLESGTPVAYLGFPMENLQGGNVDPQHPIATMQTGIVQAITDWYLKDGGFERNQLIRHSLPAAGGASGSPIFTADGTVVAVLNAGNVVLVRPDPDSADTIRIGTGADINFAQRIDLLAGVPR